MENDPQEATLALIAEIKAEKAALGMSTARLVQLSGVPKGTLERMFSNAPRAVTIGQLTGLAGALGLTSSELVARSEARQARMSEARGTTDELAERRRKQAEAADMSVDELEGLDSAATRDRELDSDEPDPT